MFPADLRWRDGDRVTRLNVVPRPFQKPHPPLWQVCSSQSSIEFAARNAIDALVWQPPPKAIRHFGQMYAQYRAEAEGRAIDPKRHLGVLRQVYVAPTMEQAESDARDGASFIFLYNNPFRGLTMFMNPGEPPPPGLKMGYDFLAERGNVLVGSPDHVVERLQELHEVGGVDYVLAEMALPYLSQRQILDSMELFVTRVMPGLAARTGDAYAR
jgi:alkanesulfonate monooxygenase SsuD/methylene tetrahydromethanopterin reductase-like flavin-dependent oxidoreductase (luciferase family)